MSKSCLPKPKKTTFSSPDVTPCNTGCSLVLVFSFLILLFILKGWEKPHLYLPFVVFVGSFFCLKGLLTEDDDDEA